MHCPLKRGTGFVFPYNLLIHKLNHKLAQKSKFVGRLLPLTFTQEFINFPYNLQKWFSCVFRTFFTCLVKTFIEDNWNQTRVCTIVTTRLSCVPSSLYQLYDNYNWIFIDWLQELKYLLTNSPSSARTWLSERHWYNKMLMFDYQITKRVGDSYIDVKYDV